AVIGKLLRKESQLATESLPVRTVAVALIARHRRYEQLGETDRLASLGHGIETLAQRRDAHMAGRRLQASCVELGAGGGGILEMGVDQLHMPETGFGDNVELAVEVAELAQAVDLDREGQGRARHGAVGVGRIKTAPQGVTRRSVAGSKRQAEPMFGRSHNV